MSLSKGFVPVAQLISLKGKTAIVTGGAQGIGLAIAARFAEAGARVVLADANRAKGGEAVQALQAIGLEAGFVPVDITDEAAVAVLCDEAAARLGSIDILVNNAGIFPFKPLAGMTGDEFLKVIDVNLKGMFVCSREAARHMARQGIGGVIINIASVDALRPSSPGLSAYDTSKGGVLALTRSLALELAPLKIRVNAIAPGGIMTEGARGSMMGPGGTAPADMRAALKAFLARTALKRMGQPDEIGRVALFLACDLSSYMTGSFVVADGGMLIS